MNSLPGLLSFTLVFICIFPGWSTGASVFKGVGGGSSLLGDRFFILS